MFDMSSFINKKINCLQDVAMMVKEKIALYRDGIFYSWPTSTVCLSYALDSILLLHIDALFMKRKWMSLSDCTEETLLTMNS